MQREKTTFPFAHFSLFKGTKNALLLGGKTLVALNFDHNLFTYNPFIILLVECTFIPTNLFITFFCLKPYCSSYCLDMKYKQPMLLGHSHAYFSSFISCCFSEHNLYAITLYSCLSVSQAHPLLYDFEYTLPFLNLSTLLNLYYLKCT